MLTVRTRSQQTAPGISSHSCRRSSLYSVTSIWLNSLRDQTGGGGERGELGIILRAFLPHCVCRIGSMLLALLSSLQTHRCALAPTVTPRLLAVSTILQHPRFQQAPIYSSPVCLRLRLGPHAPHARTTPKQRATQTTTCLSISHLAQPTPHEGGLRKVM